MRVLISGVNGFVGPWLVRHLQSCAPEAEIWGMVWGPEGREQLSSIELVEGDLTVPESLPEVLTAARPELVLHLAALSSVASSWQSPTQALAINALGQVNLFEALRKQALAPKIVLASSAEVYGKLADGIAADEELPLRPLSPYGVSKAAQELIAIQYGHGDCLPITRVRLFNLVGPGQRDSFAASSFALQIAAIERGCTEPQLLVGNLDARRDFTDVRDGVRGLWLAATRGRPGEVYNLCSGKPVSIRELLDMLLELARVPITIEIDPQRLRPAEIPELVGSNQRLRDTTGWRPEIALQQSLHDLLEWWRKSQ